jgi:hypothetical protein
MEVLNTVSPNLLSDPPKAVPVKEWPVLRCRVAGAPSGRGPVEFAGLAPDRVSGFRALKREDMVA